MPSANLSGLRCAVLGAGGFIGTNLCLALKDKVEYLRSYGRRQAFAKPLVGCNWMIGDFSDPTTLPAAVAGCDVVFHLVNATTPAGANINKVADLSANVISTLRLMDVCRESGVKRLIFVSSGGTVYGIPEIVPTPETAPTNPITAYGISKLAIEKYLNLYEYLYGLEYRILRVSNPFGPYQLANKNQGVISAFVEKSLNGKPIEIWGDGSIVRDYVYIDDVVTALLKAATHQGDGRVFNIGSGVGRSINDIAKIINDKTNSLNPVIYKDSRRVDVPVSVLDCSNAFANLNWKSVTEFDSGIDMTISWMKSNLNC